MDDLPLVLGTAQARVVARAAGQTSRHDESTSDAMIIKRKKKERKKKAGVSSVRRAGWRVGFFFLDIQAALCGPDNMSLGRGEVQRKRGPPVKRVKAVGYTLRRTDKAREKGRSLHLSKVS